MILYFYLDLSEDDPISRFHIFQMGWFNSTKNHQLGDDCPLLFTSDGTFWPDLQQNGGLDDLLRTANFGSDPIQRLRELRAAQPQGPLCNMEFWIGGEKQRGNIKYHKEINNVIGT